MAKEEEYDFTAIKVEASNHESAEGPVKKKKTKRSRSPENDIVKSNYADESEEPPAAVESKEEKEARRQARREKREAKKKAKLEKKTAKKAHGVWVGNLSFSTTRKMLFAFFADCGQVLRVNLPMIDKNKNKGYAYVDFCNEDQASIAVCKSEGELDGRKLLIKHAKDFTTTGEKPRPSSTTAAANEEGDEQQTQSTTTTVVERRQQAPPHRGHVSRKLFIGNLSFEATAENVKKYFEKIGQVETVRLSEFEDTGRCKGFAHVVFADEQSAQLAMSKRPLRMDGRMLRVEFGQHEERIVTKAPKRRQDTLALPSSDRKKIKFDDDAE